MAQLRRLDWARGLRAGLAVAAAMAVCRMLGVPMGWSALGAFEGNIVDNGGPYRIRFISIAMLMGFGSLGAVLASLASPHLARTLALTAVFSFVITYLRAAGPALITSSVIILVVYFVGIDHPAASLAGALSQAGLFLGGCAFAAILSLFLWPVYPFGHARRVIALCFGVLVQSLAEIDALLAEADAAKDQGSSWTARWFSAAQGFPNRMRSALETARSSLGSVRARTPARSVRGRNLAVLLETADILFSRGLAMVDLAERSAIEGNAGDIAFARQRLAWLGQAALLVERGLGDRARLAEVLRQGNALIAAARVANGAADSAAMFAAAFHALQAECAQHLESALEALTGIWTGADTVFPEDKSRAHPSRSGPSSACASSRRACSSRCGRIGPLPPLGCATPCAPPRSAYPACCWYGRCICPTASGWRLPQSSFCSPTWRTPGKNRCNGWVGPLPAPCWPRF